MTRRGKSIAAMVVGLMFVVGSLAVPKAFGQSYLSRLSAETMRWTGGEVATSVTPPAGSNIYTKTVFAPAHSNVLYVTLAATGDAHDGAKILVRCQVDGVDCIAGAPSSSGATGWVALQKHGGDADQHDNAVGYQWCKVIPDTGGSRTVTLDLASNGSGTVFLEAISVYIDANQIMSLANRCHSLDGD